MTPTEQRLFNVLISLVGNRYYVFPQVHLDELMRPLKYQGRRIFAFRHINQKSVDFALCDKTMRPLLAIELDDLSHEQGRRKRRDSEVGRIFSEAGLPLLRLKPQESFNQQELISSIIEKFPDFSIV